MTLGRRGGNRQCAGTQEKIRFELPPDDSDCPMTEQKHSNQSQALFRQNTNHAQPFYGYLQQPANRQANGRMQKARYSDTAVPPKGFIDPDEFPYMEGWVENAEFGGRQNRRHNSLRPQMQYRNPPCTSASGTQRHMSLTGSCSSSGFGSDFSSAATNSSRHASFSLASMESLNEQTEWADTGWQQGNNDRRKQDSLKKGSEGDGRHRSGSLAVSNNPQQHVQRSLSINVASLLTGNKQLNSKGNIFRQRKDFSAFQNLHPSKKNGYFIQLEDDSCTGNEDTRAFLLCQLTNHGASELHCIACRSPMPVYDHFPVVDGALFLSPLCHRGGLQVCWNSPASAANNNTSSNALHSPSAGQLMQGAIAPPPGCTGPRQQQSISGGSGSHFRHQQRRAPISQERYLHAICMNCMRSTGEADNPSQILCKFCSQPWNGSTLLIGGMYTYDPFAGMPCCAERLKCKSCGKQALSHHSPKPKSNSFAGSIVTQEVCPQRKLSGEPTPSANPPPLLPLPYFSQYSRMMCCQHCRAVDYHFIRPFDEIFNVHRD